MGVAQERLFKLLGDTLKIIFVLVCARSLMLIGGVPIFFIPVLDEALFQIWRAIGDLANTISNSTVLPRF